MFAKNFLFLRIYKFDNYWTIVLTIKTELQYKDTHFLTSKAL